MPRISAHADMHITAKPKCSTMVLMVGQLSAAQQWALTTEKAAGPREFCAMFCDTCACKPCARACVLMPNHKLSATTLSKSQAIVAAHFQIKFLVCNLTVSSPRNASCKGI
jgi:hypothetical protein